MPERLEDMSLERIILGEDGKSLEFILVDTLDSKKVTRIKCKAIMSFNYRVIFEDDNDGFPVYVGEVNWEKVSGNDIIRVLHDVDFPFYRPNGGVYCPNIETIYVMDIEGGEICVDLICGELQVSSAG